MKYYKNPETGQVFAYETEAEREMFGVRGLVAMTPTEVAAHLNPQPTQEQVIFKFTTQIQERLDAFASTRNYDGILSACTYATSSVQKFSVEGQRAVDLRDQTWAAAYSILDEVLNGQREMPATLDDVEPDLPVLSWSN